MSFFQEQRHQELLSLLQRQWEGFLLDASYSQGELMARVTLPSLLSCVSFLKEHHPCSFHALMDIAGVDHLGRKKRFDVVYHFLSLKHNLRLRL